MAGVGYVGFSRHTHHDARVRVRVCVSARMEPIMAHKPYNPTPDGGPER